jgi:hypothetical protein
MYLYTCTTENTWREDNQKKAFAKTNKRPPKTNRCVLFWWGLQRVLSPIPSPGLALSTIYTWFNERWMCVCVFVWISTTSEREWDNLEKKGPPRAYWFMEIINKWRRKSKKLSIYFFGLFPNKIKQRSQQRIYMHLFSIYFALKCSYALFWWAFFNFSPSNKFSVCC